MATTPSDLPMPCYRDDQVCRDSVARVSVFHSSFLCTIGISVAVASESVKKKKILCSSLISEVDKDFKPSSMALKRPEPHPPYFFYWISFPPSLGINLIPDDHQFHLLFGLGAHLLTWIP